ncbi:MAG: VanZ family protein, partial [Oscillospiraceae bacterium]|nr:VanZ family protein [Oscillospiraceae bacterium]
RRKILWWITMVIYLAVLLRITVFRPGITAETLLSGSLNLVPFSEYLRFAHNGSWSVFLYYFVGNILCFLPFGALLCRKGSAGKWYHVLALSVLLSVLIEGFQFILGTGVTETDDVVLNTLGSMIGYYLVRKITE